MKSLEQKRIAFWFLRTAAVVLLVTGLAKMGSGFGNARILSVEDPIVGVTFGKLLPAAGIAEVLVGMACLSNRVAPRFKLGLVACLATDFLLYRIGLWFVGWHHPCSCMGSLAGALHLSDVAADRIMKGVLAFLLVGSYVGLSWWRHRRNLPVAEAPPVLSLLRTAALQLGTTQP
jgi:uncharacterized membrane protein